MAKRDIKINHILTLVLRPILGLEVVPYAYSAQYFTEATESLGSILCRTGMDAFTFPESWTNSLRQSYSFPDSFGTASELRISHRLRILIRSMAERSEEEEMAPRGNDWEVVSLTASAYAAAPGPKPVEEIVGDKERTDEEASVETSQALFVSGHFLYPEKESGDAPVGPGRKNSQAPKERKVEESASIRVSDESSGSVEKDDVVEGLVITEDDLEAQERATGSEDSEVQKSLTQPAAKIIAELEESIHQSAEQPIAGGASSSDVKSMVSELTGSSVEATADEPGDVTSSKQVKDKKKARSGVPCAPWWKRQAASLYDHVKAANPLWSIVIAAAVMGLAVIGHRWQQRKSHVSSLNLQFSAKEEKPGKMLGPITRLKEAFVTGSHGSGFTRSHISSEV